MIYEWNPLWYDMDQSIISGDEGLYFLKKEGEEFSAGVLSDNDIEVFARVNYIFHYELGYIKGFVCEGLDYYLYLTNGAVIEVNSEERPGVITAGPIKTIESYRLQVDLEIIEVTGYTSQSGFDFRGRQATKQYWDIRRENWKKLLL